MSCLQICEVIVYTVVFIWILTTLSAVYICSHYLFDILPLLICQNVINAWGHSFSFCLLFWTIFDGLFQLGWNLQIGRKLSKRERKHYWNMLISQIFFSWIIWLQTVWRKWLHSISTTLNSHFFLVVPAHCLMT